MEIVCKRIVHKGWEEWQDAISLGFDCKSVFNKWQYIYTGDKGEISMIQLVGWLCPGSPWEIYCLKGDLFEDTERFVTKKEAEVRIGELLNYSLWEKILNWFKKIK